MLLPDVLGLVKPLDRIKRNNENWKSIFILISNGKYEYLYKINTINTYTCSAYIPTQDDLLATDWEIMK